MASDAPHRKVEFGEAAQLLVKNYATFQGRSSRGAYWWAWFITFLIALALSVIDRGLGAAPGMGVLGSLFGIAILLPSVAIGVRRLHDTDKSGWWMLFALVPVAGWVILLVLFLMPGERETNTYGPDVEAGR
jgi:uncharacterized membrane protein YhaH (DUF805 family)